MASETPTRNDRWLSADELRKLAAAEPESGPPPAPLHRTPKTQPRRPIAFGMAALALAVLFVAGVAF